MNDNKQDVTNKDQDNNKPEQPLPAKQPVDFTEIYTKLHEKYPKIFDLENPIMLAIGIHKQITEEFNLTIGQARFIIGKYMRKSKYLAKLGSPRFNLNGEQVGEVTQDHIDRSNPKKKANANDTKTNTN